MASPHHLIENAIDITHLMPSRPTPYYEGSLEAPEGITYLSGRLETDDVANSESPLAGTCVHWYKIHTTERFILHADAYYYPNTHQEWNSLRAYEYAFGGSPAYYDRPYPKPYNGPYPFAYLGPNRVLPPGADRVEMFMAVAWPKGAVADDKEWGTAVYDDVLQDYVYPPDQMGGNLIGLTPTDGAPVAINPGYDYYLYVFAPVASCPTDYEIAFGRRPVDEPWPMIDTPELAPDTVMWVTPVFTVDEFDEFFRYAVFTFDPQNGARVYRYLQDGDVWAYGVFGILGNYYEGIPIGWDGDQTFIYSFSYQMYGENYFYPEQMHQFQMYISKGTEPCVPIPETSEYPAHYPGGAETPFANIPEFTWFNTDTGRFVVQVQKRYPNYPNYTTHWVEISTDGVVTNDTIVETDEWVNVAQREFTNPGYNGGSYHAMRKSLDGTEIRGVNGFGSVYRSAQTYDMWQPSTVEPGSSDITLTRYDLDYNVIAAYTYPWMENGDFRSCGIEDDGEHFWVQDRSYDVYGSYRTNQIPDSVASKGIHSATNGYMYRLPCFEPTPERPEEPMFVAHSHLLISGHGDLTDNLFLNWQPKSIMGVMAERRKSIWMGGKTKQIPVPQRTFVVP